MTRKPRRFSGTLADSPFGTEHQPPERSKYREYRPCLRLDYGFRCAYCGSHEVEVSNVSPFGLFEVDHFRPKSWKQFRRLQASYSNLRWACALCNRTKGEAWPSEQEQAGGYRLLDPVSDVLSEHIVENAEHELEALTDNGQYFIDTFDLNSKLHRLRRSLRPNPQLVAALRIAVENAAGAAPQLQEDLAKLAAHLDESPHDAPDDCLCSKRSRRPSYLRLVN